MLNLNFLSIASTTFYTLTAIDQDYGINSPLKYTIVDGSNGYTDYFELVRDGESVKVVNKKIMDRETLEDPVLSLTIEATETEQCPTEGCLKTATECMMLIEDKNDNPPRFDSTQYTASVKESITLGQIIPFETENGDGKLISQGELSKILKQATTKIKVVFVAACMSQFVGEIF